jgi:hypothetical protein
MMNTVGRWIIGFALCAAVYPIARTWYSGPVDWSSYFFGFVVASAQGFVFNAALSWGRK